MDFNEIVAIVAILGGIWNYFYQKYKQNEN